MPEGNDPFGYLALHQQISKEMRSAIAFNRSQRSTGGSSTAAFVVTNPITGIDRIIETRQGSRSTRNPSEARTVLVSQSSMRASTVSAAHKQQRELTERMAELEQTLKDEREGRVKVQRELERLESLVQSKVM